VSPKILVGLDGSARQPAVLARAAAQAQLQGAELHLCRAVTVPVHLPPEVWAIDGQALAHTLLRHAETELQEVARELPKLAGKFVHVRLGVAADVLCSLADTLGVDLIVLGTHGYEAIDRVLGTTAAKVVNRAHTSVLVVRSPPIEDAP